MDAKSVAEEFFEIVARCKNNLNEIPQNCSQGENGVLAYLTFIENKISPSELSKILNVSLPRIASILNSLENKKLICKNIDCKDKRKTIVEITEEGQKLVLQRKEEAINNLTIIMEKLTEEERNDYLRLTKRIIEIIHEL